MRSGEIGISAGMATLAVVFYALASFQQEINPVDPGPAFYPRLVSLLLFAFAAAQLILSWRSKKVKEPPKEPVSLLLSILGTLVLSVVYILAFAKASYLITTTIFLIALMLVGGVRKWLVLLSVAAGYSLATYYLFGQVLKVPLP